MKQTVFKEVFLKSRGGSVIRKTLAVFEAEALLNSRRDETWEKYVSLASWKDSERSQLVEYDFWIDLDAKEKSGSATVTNIEKTVPNCRLLVDLLNRKYSLPVETIGVFFSGHGGFHILLPFRLARPVDTKLLCDRIRTLTSDWQKELDSRWDTRSKLDAGIYNPKGMMRNPWSLHNSGLRKVPLTRKELDLSPNKLLKLIERRSKEFSGTYDFEWFANIQSFDALCQAVFADIDSAATDSRMKDSQYDWFSQVLADAKKEAPCLSEICEFRLPVRGFNNVKQFLVSQMKKLGHPPDLAGEFVSQFAEQYAKRQGKPFSKVRERSGQAESATRSIYSSTDPRYDFTLRGRCQNFLKGFTTQKKGLPCTKFHCRYYNSRAPVTGLKRERLDRLMRKGLKPNEFYIFMELAVFGQAESIENLYSRANLSKGTVTRALKRLEEMRLVETYSQAKRKGYRVAVKIKKSFLVKK